MKKAEDQAKRRAAARRRRNAEFVRGLLRRRPDLTLQDLQAGAKAELAARAPGLEAAGEIAGWAGPTPGLVLETIVDKERPVLFVQGDWLNVHDVWAPGVEAQDLIAATVAQEARLRPLMPLIGRIDASHFPNMEFVGTGWLIAPDVVVTNRHVASLIARWDGRRFTFRRGVGGNTMTSTFDTLREADDLDIDDARRFSVTEVLYIEPESGTCDIAFLRVARRTDGLEPTHIRIAPADLGDDEKVLVVGYPARASPKVIPNQDLMEMLYRGRFDVKRAAPGYTMSRQQGAARHDCTTLGGNSGSVVLDLRSGEAVGLHFAGLYEEANYAVSASALNDYVRQRRWNRRPAIETAPPPATPFPTATTPSASGSSVTVPLTITLGLGAPTVSLGAAPADTGALPAAPRRISDAEVEAAVKAFWGQRPDGVVGARVGYETEGDRFNDEPVIAASVEADQLDAIAAAGPQAFQAVPVRYFPATVQEIAEARGVLESSSTVAYDDNARTGPDFSFALVDEAMDVLAHVGPEYSWEVLQAFLRTTDTSMVSGIYEFHAPHIYDAIEARLEAGVDLQLVMDRKTFHGDEAAREARFHEWAEEHAFERIVAPAGASGLMSDSYHIKVTVRQDDTFWLSSGNWKDRTSQPIVTQEQRDRASIDDIRGNREWHVVIKNATLAKRLRNHLKQDFKRAEQLGSGPVPEAPELAELEIALPIEEAVELERPAPGRVLPPRSFGGVRRVTPLLTPDRKGAVYSEAVLELIRSAQSSLLFQIPYITMASNPTQDRGYIDALILALTQKLKTLDDARLLLRSGGSEFAAPAHAAWFFKSKGVDIANRLRVIDNHHTKGMIVDDARCLLGSHNWSRPGVSLNRDASLLFEDPEIAAYYKDAFEIDWDRARRINPRQFVRRRQEGVEGAGAAGDAASFRRVRLADVLAEMDD